MLQHENVIERIYIHLHPYLSPRAKAVHGNDYSYRTITAVDPGSSVCQGLIEVGYKTLRSLQGAVAKCGIQKHPTKS